MNNNTKATYKAKGGAASDKPRRSRTQARLSKHAKVGWQHGENDKPR